MSKTSSAAGHGRATTALAREELRRQLVALDRTRDEMSAYRHEMNAYKHEYEQMRKSADHHRAVADERLEELQSIKAERAYRAAIAVRRAGRSVWPRR